MKFSELRPSLTTSYLPHASQLGFDCPTCGRRTFIYVYESEPKDHIWKISKHLDDCGRLSWNDVTITPSINLDDYNHGPRWQKQCWHGSVTNGEVS